MINDEMRKWIHYSKHAKKFRVRKKYINKIKRYYEKHSSSLCNLPRWRGFGGNWHLGAHAGLFSIGFINSQSYPPSERVAYWPD